MRKIILSCLLLGISLTTYAQTSLFDLWQEASEHVNIYTYGLKKINKDLYIVLTIIVQIGSGKKVRNWKFLPPQ